MQFGGIIATDKMKQEEDLRSGNKSYFYDDDDDDDVISTLTDDETFEKGVELGAGVAVGFSLVSLGIGLTAGVLGLIYERVTGE